MGGESFLTWAGSTLKESPRNVLILLLKDLRKVSLCGTSFSRKFISHVTHTFADVTCVQDVQVAPWSRRRAQRLGGRQCPQLGLHRKPAVVSQQMEPGWGRGWRRWERPVLVLGLSSGWAV